jgi:hypothetical protein
MACTACLVCFISTVNGYNKKRKENVLEDVALVAGTQQNLSNLYSLDVYDSYPFHLKVAGVRYIRDKLETLHPMQ